MNTFICKRCGYIAFKDVPDKCPVCHAPKEDFELKTDAIKKPQNPNNLSELEKKHIPVIEIKKQCGLLGPGCADAHIKVGEITHPMEAKHFIVYIDIYHDYNFIARYHLSPEKLNPAVGIHLKITEGKIIALEYCNLHGRWMAEKEI
ncbi:MAG: desulfoferrodoxin [Candidatus Omnitrophica bacterium]|nr:desulfoferrodoxin [Candidatus Omnitrophota bacterium]